MSSLPRFRADRQRIAPDPVALALQALAWLLSDADRSARLLALTGLAPAELRARATEPALLGAVLAFLEGQEAELVACATALEIEPQALVAARGALDA